MKDKKVYYFIVIVIMALALCGWCASAQIKENSVTNQLLYSIMIGIVTGVIATVLYTICQSYFWGDDNQKMKSDLKKIDEELEKIKKQIQFNDDGVESIIRKGLVDYEYDFWNSIIKETNTTLNLVGHSLSHWFDEHYVKEFKGKIVELLNADKDVNIILSCDKQDFSLINVKKSLDDHTFTVIGVENTLRELYGIIDSLEDKSKATFLNIYIADRNVVTYMYIETDKKCIISPYMKFAKGNSSYVMQLIPESEFAKGFQAEFRHYKKEGKDLIKVNLNEIKLLKEWTFELSQQHCTLQNRYNTRGWCTEDTYKFVYKKENKLYEVGYFKHYDMSGQVIKDVIELPSSYGCGSKCKFCASSKIDEFKPIDEEELKELFTRVYYEQKLQYASIVLVTMTGIGDMNFNRQNVLKFLQYLEDFKNVQITVSSCFWNSELLGNVEKIKNIRRIQLTYISSVPEIVNELTQTQFFKKEYWSEVVNYIKTSRNSFYRINYICIKGKNDSEKNIEGFITSFSEIKNKVIVRISKLNPTMASISNGLEESSLEDMRNIENRLKQEGFSTYLFYSEKNDNMNCGQLITEKYSYSE